MTGMAMMPTILLASSPQERVGYPCATTRAPRRLAVDPKTYTDRKVQAHMVVSWSCSSQGHSQVQYRRQALPTCADMHVSYCYLLWISLPLRELIYSEIRNESKDPDNFCSNGA